MRRDPNSGVVVAVPDSADSADSDLTVWKSNGDTAFDADSQVIQGRRTNLYFKAVASPSGQLASLSSMATRRADTGVAQSVSCRESNHGGCRF
jgi:hypothetical protein